MGYNNNNKSYTFANGAKLTEFNTMDIPAMYYLQAEAESIGLQHGTSVHELDKYLHKINEIAIASTDNLTDKLAQIVTLSTILKEKRDLFMNQYNVLRISTFYFYIDESEKCNTGGQTEELIERKTKLILNDNEALFFFIKFVKKKLKNFTNITDKDFTSVLKLNQMKTEALK